MCEKLRDGRRAMLLIPGLGFGDDIWSELMEHRMADFTMYAVTLPGFGDAPPLPMSTERQQFGDKAWTRSTIQANEVLLDRGISPGSPSRPIGRWPHR